MLFGGLLLSLEVYVRLYPQSHSSYAYTIYLNGSFPSIPRLWGCGLCGKTFQLLPPALRCRRLSPTMASSKPIPQPKRAAGADFASSFASSFMAASPIAQEILARDIAQCSEDDAPGGEYAVDEADSDTDSRDGPTLYRRPLGVTFGYRRPSLLPEQVDEPILTRIERKVSRNAERSLLRDNHILPPKHVVTEEPGPVTKVYKWMFSTKVRRPVDDEEAPVAGPSETSPLLPEGGLVVPSSQQQEHEHLNEQWEAAVASGKIQTTWQREAKTIGAYSWPMIITFLLQYSVNIASIFAVGHIGKVELGAISLGTMTASITCYAPFQGLATCLDTLCAQAYGSGHRHLVGLQVQRMVYFLGVLLVPVAFLWLNAETILRQLIPEARAAELAGLYLKIALAGVPGFLLLECGKRFVQAQGLFHATTYVLIIAAPFNILCNYLFVWRFGWGYIGAPIAVAVTQNLMAFLLFLYVIFIEGSQCWGGFSKRALANWGPMIKLALPGMIMVVAEWLAFEILTLASSQFGSSYLAAQSIVTTLASTTFQIPFPISIAASTRVANFIGARLVQAAKTSAKVAVVISFLVAAINVLVLSTLRYQLPRLFTDDAEVIEFVAQVLPLVAVMQVFDSVAAMSHGLLRGIGKQHFGSYSSLLSYYLVGLPISFGTGFGLDWKLEGLWFGVTLGLVLVAIVEYCYIYMTDWNQSVAEAEHRNAAE
ncbi:MATE efflux family protein [Xylariales sp. PMI_506]|nr:MATE efflux family protein [Xylariales sp. PMI_506]